jgi:hypothetical protein
LAGHTHRRLLAPKAVRGVIFVAALAVFGLVASGAASGSERSAFGSCSQAIVENLQKQLNVHAFLRLQQCGAAVGGEVSTAAAASAPTPFLDALIGGTDRDVINPPDSAPPHDTQSESAVAANGSTIVVNYNDSRDSPSVDYSGASVSTDGGTTWTRIDPFKTGHGQNFGDPIIVYNQKFGKFVAGDLVGGCGGQGIGIWTSTNGTTWSTGPCAHSGSDDDRESIAVDNDPASPFYGNIYITWNNFALGVGALVATRSTDGGATWSAQTVINSTATFYRDTQLAVQPGNGQVDLVGMDEGGGGFNARHNWFFRSTNGGTSWNGASPISMGASFAAGGDQSNGYFVGYHPIWRAMGWGNPVPTGPMTIVYPYYGHGASSDVGDIFVVRSTDNGTTWSAPTAISTAVNAQWFSQAVSDGGNNVAIWYYTRQNTTNGDNYEIYARQSTDGGATWAAASPLSDSLIDQPVQNDSFVQPFYGGDYNYTTSDQTSGAHSNRLLMTWTDGRNLLSGVHTQDVDIDQISLGGGTAKIVAKKRLFPSTDPGRFDLLVDSTVVAAAVGDFGKGSTIVAAGTHTVSEKGANGTDLNLYNKKIVCRKNGVLDVSGPGPSIDVTVAGGDKEVCTLKNTRI